MKTFFVTLAVFLSSMAFAEPDCSAPNSWPATIAILELRNANRIDDSKSITVTKIASSLLKKNLWRQVHQIEFLKPNGEKLEVLTVNNATDKDCSASNVSVYLKINSSKSRSN